MVLALMTVTGGETADGFSNPLLSQVGSITPDIDPRQAKMVRVMELPIGIAGFLDCRYKFIVPQGTTSII